jgi:hypothetical protein
LSGNGARVDVQDSATYNRTESNRRVDVQRGQFVTILQKGENSHVAHVLSQTAVKGGGTLEIDASGCGENATTTLRTDNVTGTIPSDRSFSDIRGGSGPVQTAIGNTSVVHNDAPEPNVPRPTIHVSSLTPGTIVSNLDNVNIRATHGAPALQMDGTAARVTACQISQTNPAATAAVSLTSNGIDGTQITNSQITHVAGHAIQLTKDVTEAKMSQKSFLPSTEEDLTIFSSFIQATQSGIIVATCSPNDKVPTVGVGTVSANTGEAFMTGERARLVASASNRLTGLASTLGQNVENEQVANYYLM